jgi:ClpP class serine protease
VLTKDGPAWYGSNYDGIVTAAEKAAGDPDVKRIVLAVDSPGGEVIGCPEAAAALAQIAKTKPVSAVVEGCCASAAYWLTS